VQDTTIRKIKNHSTLEVRAVAMLGINRSGNGKGWCGVRKKNVKIMFNENRSCGSKVIRCGEDTEP
jgi:hypothetical protein